MKTARIQTLMDRYEQARTTRNEAVAKCEAATLKLDTQMSKLAAQIAKIEKEHKAGIEAAQAEMNAAEVILKVDAHAAWLCRTIFPAGKKRLPLDRGAWVQVSERIKREVTDPSAAVRFIVEEGIEDTTIKSLSLESDAVDAVVALKKKFPGVAVYTEGKVSISLPKKKKEEE